MDKKWKAKEKTSDNMRKLLGDKVKREQQMRVKEVEETFREELKSLAEQITVLKNPPKNEQLGALRQHFQEKLGKGSSPNSP